MAGKTIVLFILLAGILFFAIRYVLRARKGGAACIGCPHRKACRQKNFDCQKEKA